MRRRKPTPSDIFLNFCVDGPRPSVGSNTFVILSSRWCHPNFWVSPFLFHLYFLSLWYENTFNLNTDIDRTFNSLCSDGYEQICFYRSYGNCDSSICLLWCLFNCKPQHDKQRFSQKMI